MSFESPRPRILAIEDDAILAAHIQSHLQQQGFEVELHTDGALGLQAAQSESFELVLLDLMLPSLSGLEVLTSLREQQVVPVILMSALGAEHHRIKGFSQGADDYLPKPFSLGELQVRIEAILRRVRYERGLGQPERSVGGLDLDHTYRDLCYQGQMAGLTDTEFRLLQALASTPGEAMSKAFLYQHVLNRPLTTHDRGLDMHVSHLRRKLRAIQFNSARIETVWGVGYVYREADAV